MKTINCLLLLACLQIPMQAEDKTKFEVHEWGTITVLSGSDGIPLNWYQGWGDADPLPSFVQINPSGSKALWPAQEAPVRMETPVIYFYPEAPRRVTVSTAFKDGDLTEWFPAVKQLGTAALSPPLPFIWEGDLSPPGDTKAQAQIPDVPAGKGDHYRHAREVPDAWIFRSAAVPARSAKDPNKGKDADKFIFYRGKGQSTPPYRVQTGSDGRVTLSHVGYGAAIPAAFMLTVAGNSAQWARMPRLEAHTRNSSLSSQAESIVRPSTTQMEVDRAEEELTTEMHKALESAGLTRDEARAMVATWSGHWFREPGTRVLAILPREWVDSVLPLTITPAPTRVERVFVARFEVLTPQRESELLALLNEDADATTLGTRLTELQLGRFGRGALARAQVMENQRMAEKFELLRQAALDSPLECKTAAVQ